MSAASVWWTTEATPVGTSVSRILYSLQQPDKDDDDYDPDCLFDKFGMDDARKVAMFDGGCFKKDQMDGVVVLSKNLERVAKIFQDAFNRKKGENDPECTGFETDTYKRQGTTNVLVVLSFSDGQTVSLFFSNPDITPSKILPDDKLVMYKVMLNRTDITVVVAPEGNRAIKVLYPVTVANRIIQLVHKNSANFIKRNAAYSAKVAEASQLAEEMVGLNSQLEANQLAEAQLDDDIATANLDLEAMIKERDALKEQLATMPDQQQQQNNSAGGTLYKFGTGGFARIVKKDDGSFDVHISKAGVDLKKAEGLDVAGVLDALNNFTGGAFVDGKNVSLEKDSGDDVLAELTKANDVNNYMPLGGTLMFLKSGAVYMAFTVGRGEANTDNVIDFAKIPEVFAAYKDTWQKPAADIKKLQKGDFNLIFKNLVDAGMENQAYILAAKRTGVVSAATIDNAQKALTSKATQLKIDVAMSPILAEKYNLDYSANQNTEVDDYNGFFFPIGVRIDATGSENVYFTDLETAETFYTKLLDPNEFNDKVGQKVDIHEYVKQHYGSELTDLKTSVEQVDAAYKFDNATSEFKMFVAQSIKEPEYSPFATSVVLDKAVKSYVKDGVKVAAYFEYNGNMIPQEGYELVATIKANNGRGTIGYYTVGGDGKALVFVKERDGKIRRANQMFFTTDDQSIEAAVAELMTYYNIGEKTNNEPLSLEGQVLSKLAGMGWNVSYFGGATTKGQYTLNSNYTTVGDAVASVDEFVIRKKGIMVSIVNVEANSTADDLAEKIDSATVTKRTKKAAGQAMKLDQYSTTIADITSMNADAFKSAKIDEMLNPVIQELDLAISQSKLSATDESTAKTMLSTAKDLLNRWTTIQQSQSAAGLEWLILAETQTQSLVDDPKKFREFVAATKADSRVATDPQIKSRTEAVMNTLTSLLKAGVSKKLS